MISIVELDNHCQKICEFCFYFHSTCTLHNIKSTYKASILELFFVKKTRVLPVALWNESVLHMYIPLVWQRKTSQKAHAKRCSPNFYKGWQQRLAKTLVFIQLADSGKLEKTEKKGLLERSWEKNRVTVSYSHTLR